MKHILGGFKCVVPDLVTVIGVTLLCIAAVVMVGCEVPFDDSEANNNTTVEVHDGGTVTIVDNESELSTEAVEGKTRYEIPTRDGYKVVYQ
jgi:hypothetical protein